MCSCEYVVCVCWGTNCNTNMKRGIQKFNNLILRWIIFNSDLKSLSIRLIQNQKIWIELISKVRGISWVCNQYSEEKLWGLDFIVLVSWEQNKRKVNPTGDYQISQSPKNFRLNKQLMKVVSYFPIFKNMKTKYS